MTSYPTGTTDLDGLAIPPGWAKVAGLPVSEVRLEVTPVDGANAFTVNRWEGYSYTLKHQGISNFTLKLPPIPANRALITKYGGSKFKLFYDGALQFTGLIDERSDDTSLDNTDLQLTGRDYMGLLADSVVEPSNLNIKGKTLDDIASQVILGQWPGIFDLISTNMAASRYIAAGGGSSGGSSTRDLETRTGKAITFSRQKTSWKSKYAKFGQNSPVYAGIGNEQIKTNHIKFGTTVAAMMNDLAAQVGSCFSMTCDGVPCLYRPCYTFDAKAYGDGIWLLWDNKLKRARRGGNVEGARVSTSIAGRKSHWYITGKGKKSKKSRGKENILAGRQIKDVGESFWERNGTTLGAARLHKPGKSAAKKTNKQEFMVRQARRMVAQSILGGLSMSYMLPGHHSPSGALWVPDTCVNIFDERNEIAGNHYITQVERRHDSNGRKSVLSVIPTDIWLGALDDPTLSDEQWYAGMIDKVWW